MEVLREKFEEALAQPGIVGLNIATRADCLPQDAVDYLASLAGRTHLTVELGLQSSSDRTAARIRRGHTWADFLDGYRRLRAAGGNISLCVHLIFGLPGEDDARMLESVRDVAALHPEQVKLHLLHVLRGFGARGIISRWKRRTMSVCLPMRWNCSRPTRLSDG